MKSILKKTISGFGPPAHQLGFTLIELTATIAIFVVLAAIAVPSYQNMVRSDTAEELVSELQLARMIAIRRQTWVTVTFPQAGGDLRQFTVTWASDNNGTVQTKTVTFDRAGEGFQFDLNPPGAAPPGPDTMFAFSPLGFIRTQAGNVPGNIYIVNRTGANAAAAAVRGARYFRIQTNIAGGITINRFDPSNNAWINAL